MGALRGTWIIARRELEGYFLSPIAYVAIAGFTILSGWIFFKLVARYTQLMGLYMQFVFQNPEMLSRVNLHAFVIEPTYLNLTILLVILFPMLTMRLFAEERRQHTDELLFTSPISTTAIVGGKFLALMGVYLLMLLPTVLYPAVLMKYANPAPAISEFISIYLGLILMGMCFGAVGFFTSCLTTNQIVAAVSCFVVLLLFYVIDWVANTTSGVTRDVLSYISLIRRYQDFVKGMVDLKSLIYFLSVTLLGLTLAKYSLDSLRLRS